MNTTTYNLTGVFGTLITITVTTNEHNVATHAELHIEAVSDGAPEYFSDALTVEKDFIISGCFDCDMKSGDKWALALDSDGMLTHEDMAFNPQYVETFTTNVKD